MKDKSRGRNIQSMEVTPGSGEKTLTKRKVFFFWTLILMFLFLLTEVLSYVIITSAIPSRIKVRIGQGDAELRVKQRELFSSAGPRIIRPPKGVDMEKINSESLLLFSPHLGWDYPPDIVYELSGDIYSHGPNGERINVVNYDTTSIATYGDSFTYGAEVPDSETWQTFLASRIKSNVLNFGIGGAGSDQALLKYQMHGPTGAKVVFLGIFPENINRVVNIFRPFYSHHEANALTKPRFIPEDGKFKLLNNPITKPEDVKKLLDPEFVRNLGKFDYWYQLDQRLPRISFPFSYSLYQYRKPVFEQITLSASRFMPSAFKPVFPWNLYSEPEPFSVLKHIVDSFVETANSRGDIPVIVIMPHKDQVQELMDYKVSRFEPLLAHMKKKGYRFIDLVQMVAEKKPDRAQLEKWYQGHATREGNRIAAELIGQYLDDNPDLLNLAR